jgi:enoyl-CoA hydratase/long-chain 3-hydroxyacyl-CoA dehydrogenase
MGAGIAQVSVKGFDILLKDATPAGLSRGQNQVYTGLDKAMKRRKITRYETLCNFSYWNNQNIFWCFFLPVLSVTVFPQT